MSLLQLGLLPAEIKTVFFFVKKETSSSLPRATTFPVQLKISGRRWMNGYMACDTVKKYNPSMNYELKWDKVLSNSCP